MLNPPPNIEALRVLLERLFPEIHISSTGVALLAAQIAELENRCELMPDRIDHQPARKAEATTVGTRVLLLPHAMDCEGKYGTNNHAK
jgi:hypothetical protein